ncbi:MAG: dTDP-glucose 4,6-dehydratase [Candidatus Omnitrophica bacterium]|nr:dTDP-glucose 4,6-dehydratase [Candidatus Omnitrophota bacterium]
MKNKILVTGGAGFIGSNFIHYILDKYPDCKVVNLDKLTYAGRKENLKDLEHNPRYSFIKGDVCDSKIVAKAIKGCERIVHFAAESHVDRSIADAREFIHTNVLGTHVLLEAARKQKISLFCHISTDEVYGSRMKGSFKETDALEPSSPYSASKAAADHQVISYYITYKLPIIIIRPTNNFGPFQFPEKIIPLFVTNILEGKKVPVYGDGQNVRDWLYVLDCCAAIDFIVHKGKIGEIYNLAGKNEMKNLDLTRLILDIMNQSESFIKFVKDRPGHDRRYSLDNTKLKKLGFISQHDFTKALQDTVEWYRNNRKWWKALKS